MGAKLGVVAAVILLVAVALGSGCFFGGDDGGGTGGTVLRRGSIPTATPPANLPEPILLGQSQATTAGASTTPAASGGTYVVKSGDTLGAVATALGIPQDQQAAWIADVLRLNGIDDVRLLRAGQELTLPRGTTATAPTTTGGTVAPTATRPPAIQAPATQAPAATATSVPPATGGGGGTYTVVDGDNPVVIGLKLGVPSGELAAWANELLILNGTTPSGLRIGQVLQLPPSTPR